MIKPNAAIIMPALVMMMSNADMMRMTASINVLKNIQGYLKDDPPFPGAKDIVGNIGIAKGTSVFGC